MDKENTQTGSEIDSQSELETIKRPSSSSRGTVIFGLVVVVTIFFGLGIWSALAPLAKAVSAPGTVAVKGERKKIQHLEGGIVDSIHVEEGEHVEKGQLLVALSPLQAGSTVSRQAMALDEALAREARLESELRGDISITVEGELLDRLSVDEKIIKILETEEEHFIARRNTLESHISILNKRIDQLDKEMEGLKVQKAARLEQYDIFQEEISGLRELSAKGYYAKTKVLAMERAMSEIKGEAGSDTALIARSQSSKDEAENQIISLRKRFREEVIGELRNVKLEIRDVKEQLLVAKDVLSRIEVRAPRSGLVQAIQVHTIGGVVRPGDILMEISPQDHDLVIKAQVSPNDIESLAIGQTAEVRMVSLNVRTTPAIYGSVRSMSGDSLIDEVTQKPFFLTFVEIPAEEWGKLNEIKLTAGMPAEVLIQTGERTLLDYLLKPMTDALHRGMNED